MYPCQVSKPLRKMLGDYHTKNWQQGLRYVRAPPLNSEAYREPTKQALRNSVRSTADVARAALHASGCFVIIIIIIIIIVVVVIMIINTVLCRQWNKFHLLER
jgi:hypothetical protein